MTLLYRHYTKRGKLLYIGISTSPMARLHKHYLSSPWFRKVATIKVEHYPCKGAALIAERVAIEKERPPHNYRYTRADININAGEISRWLASGMAK